MAPFYFCNNYVKSLYIGLSICQCVRNSAICVVNARYHRRREITEARRSGPQSVDKAAGSRVVHPVVKVQT